MADSTRNEETAARRRVPATRAAKTFGRIVDHVREARAVYVVERAGRPVAQIGLLRGGGEPGAEFRREVRAGVRAGNKPAVPADPWAR